MRLVTASLVGVSIVVIFCGVVCVEAAARICTKLVDLQGMLTRRRRSPHVCTRLTNALNAIELVYRALIEQTVEEVLFLVHQFKGLPAWVFSRVCAQGQFLTRYLGPKEYLNSTQ